MHTIWSPNVNNRTYLNSTGSALADVILNNTNFTLLTPPDTPTHYNKHYNLKSTIDLTFGSGMLSSCEKVYVGELHGTDHYPIIYCFNYIPNKSVKNTPLTWDFKNINWDLWKVNLISNFNSSNCECTVSNISKIILETTKQSIDLKSKQITYKHHKPFWSPECSYHIALRRKAQKHYEKFPTIENKTALNRQTAMTKRFLLKKKEREMV